MTLIMSLEVVEVVLSLCLGEPDSLEHLPRGGLRPIRSPTRSRLVLRQLLVPGRTSRGPP